MFVGGVQIIPSRPVTMRATFIIGVSFLFALSRKVYPEFFLALLAMQKLDGLFGALPQYLLMLRSQYWSKQQLDAYLARHLRLTLEAACSAEYHSTESVCRPAKL